jgi:hypothetical protein
VHFISCVYMIYISLKFPMCIIISYVNYNFLWQALNVQFISWAPWDPYVMTQNAKMNKDKVFEPVKELV